MSKTSLGPDYIGIGAMKAASGWIFKCLELHPEVGDSEWSKELHFFTKPYNYEKGIEYYYSLFSQHPKGKLKGEFTPAYMASPQVASLIHKHFPNVKLIVSLRNPIERAYSHYRYNVQERGRFRIYKNFEDTIKNDKTIIERGFYYKHLKPYFDLFPRENILILFFEDIKNNPKEVVHELYKFLGLKDISYIPSLINRRRSITGAYIIKHKFPILNLLIYWLNSKIKKEGSFRKFTNKFKIEILYNKLQKVNRKEITAKNIKALSVPPLSQSDRDYLLKIYKDDIQNLEKLLNKDLKHWK
ncbi:MAG: sulfotransferase domain-containing protein [Candidatus Hodarchaeota archaeon]